MKNNLVILLLAALIFGCQESSDETPSSVISPELVSTTEKKAFLDQIEGYLSTSDVQDQFAEPLGDVHFEDLVYFKSDFEENVTFIPLYAQESKHTEAIIIGTEHQGSYKLGMLVRGNLWKYSNQDNKSIPSLYTLALIFKKYDQHIFENDNASLQEIIGTRPNSTGTMSRSIDIEPVGSNVKSEWHYEEFCAGWGFEGELECWVGEIYWVESASEVIMIDQGGSSGGAGPYVPRRIEDHIDDSTLKPCMKNLLNSLKNQTKGMSFIISKFNGATPGYNWKLTDAPLPPGVNGGTSQLYNRSTGTVTSTFDSKKFQNSSDLSVARTILHEAVHAYLIAHFRNNYSAAYKSYPDLIHDMNKNIYPQNANGLQHAEFVRNFVNDIATSLQEFGTGRGYNLPFQYYSDLAWAGLTDWPKRDSSGNLIKDSQGNQVYEETPWFKSTFNNPADRQRVKNNIINEQGLNGNNAKKGQNAGC